MKTAPFTKSYRGRTVLSLPALELPRGEITALIGPNGSGKTTFARLLAGQEKSDERRPVLTGARVGYMPQRSFAFRMSTEKNVLLGGTDAESARELMKALGIDALSRQRAKKLSGGETQKMALCRILMGRFDLLVLDEPTAAMDMETTLAAEELIRRKCEVERCAVLLVTHSVSQARRLASRTVYLQGGELVEQGETRALLERPHEERTRRFLDFYGI